MKNVRKCKITALSNNDVNSDEVIESMLAKAGVEEFVFGYPGFHVSWSVATVDDELYARRTVGASMEGAAADYYRVGLKDRERICELYDMVAADVASYNFKGYLSPEAKGLQELLDVFGRKFSNFMSRVMVYCTHPLVEEGYGH